MRVRYFIGYVLPILLLPLSAAAQATQFGPPPPDTSVPDYTDPLGDGDGDGFYNGIDRCPREWGNKTPGCPSCEDILKRENIPDLNEFLKSHNFGVVGTCGGGQTIYRCAKPDIKLAMVARYCLDVQNIVCLSGGLSGAERLVDNHCRSLSERVCMQADLQFFNDCRPAIRGEIDLTALKTLVEEIFLMKGNTIIHCLHGRDRTGTVASLIYAIRMCGGKPEPERSDCIAGVRKFYLLENDENGPLNAYKYPALLAAFDECVQDLVPGEIPPVPPPPAPTPTPTPTPVPTPTPPVAGTPPTR